MMDSHISLLHAAKVMIDRVAGDKSVDEDTKVESLEELAELIEQKISSLGR